MKSLYECVENKFTGPDYTPLYNNNCKYNLN